MDREAISRLKGGSAGRRGGARSGIPRRVPGPRFNGTNAVGIVGGKAVGLGKDDQRATGVPRDERESGNPAGRGAGSGRLPVYLASSCVQLNQGRVPRTIVG